MSEKEKDIFEETTPCFETEIIDYDIEKKNNKISKIKKTKAEKATNIFIEKKETFKNIINSLPCEKEYFHIVNNSKFDFYTIIPCVIDICKNADEIYISTWVMSTQNIHDIFDKIDTGKINKISILTGLYFKRRNTSIYSILVNGMAKRKMKVVSFRNHCKILLIKNKNNFYVIEGSANLNANPRLEQYIFTNNKEVYDFHKKWMEDKLNE